MAKTLKYKGIRACIHKLNLIKTYVYKENLIYKKSS